MGNLYNIRTLNIGLNKVVYQVEPHIKRAREHLASGKPWVRSVFCAMARAINIFVCEKAILLSNLPGPPVSN